MDNASSFKKKVDDLEISLMIGRVTCHVMLYMQKVKKDLAEEGKNTEFTLSSESKYGTYKIDAILDRSSVKMMVFSLELDKSEATLLASPQFDSHGITEDVYTFCKNNGIELKVNVSSLGYLNM